MNIVATAIPDVRIVTPRRFEDHRGFFSETFNARAFAEAGLPSDFVQDNHSLSRPKGTVRGLHFQIPPFAQAKLVRVVRGSILDVAVDLRRASATFGKSVAVVLTALEGNQLFIPVGFAHGFCTLESDTEVLYKVTAPYSAADDRGLLWNDPDLAIDWPVPADLAVLSEKDKNHPGLRNLPAYF
ncbi:dTDP-4-dehydrorhamnose 3,5-epimerase [Telmatospirillum sp.]|uniref:dTDP-4-dehydrorhamnose 3,5-epimerase n=1 Tax=Telmatospirillum sp. TaxID=2079197 RepID=UPI00284ECEBE|nr:dTDP-4-dehydrorhamnose 3,5-epimerase [Telmatospirillum sp.]MDR3439721.1 dTDP-4-dehydrorhamnose 3,5-epimerase [Telmatospirillum sp.]